MQADAGWGEVGVIAGPTPSRMDLWEAWGSGGQASRDVRKGSRQITETRLRAEEGEEQRTRWTPREKAQGSVRGAGLIANNR